MRTAAAKHRNGRLGPGGLGFLACTAWAGVAAAENNPLATAADAFGERVGVEQTGLYNESQVRGFGIGNTGSHRIDGRYFVREGYLPDAILDGVSVRIGVNANRQALAAPSGIVDFRLKQARPGVDVLEGSVFLQPQGAPQLTLDARLGGLGPGLGVVAAAQLKSDRRYPDGRKGSYLGLGLAPSLTSAAGHARAILAYEYVQYNGDYGYSSDHLPRLLPRGEHFAPPSGNTTYRSYNIGADGGYQLSETTSVNVSAYRSIVASDIDYTSLRFDAADRLKATLFRTPDGHARSDAAEARITRELDGLGGRHRLTALATLRNTRIRTAATQVRAFPGLDPLSDPYPAFPPAVATPGRNRDAVDAYALGAALASTWGDRAELRLSGKQVDYEKRRTPLSGPPSRAHRTEWVYDGSFRLRLDARYDLFSSYVTGLEDTGVAPQSATNRNEVLDPVRAKEMELGVRAQLHPSLTLVAAVFSVEKPIASIAPDGVYRFIGTARNRGVEASLTGQIGDTSILAGVAWIDPRVSGELVEAGRVDSLAPGVSRLTAVCSLEHALDWAPGWSATANVTYRSARSSDAVKSFVAPSTAVLDLGARYRGTTPAGRFELRVAMQNVTGNRRWLPDTSGTFSQLSSRSIYARLTLTRTLAP